MKKIFFILFLFCGYAVSSERGESCSGSGDYGDLICHKKKLVNPCEVGTNWAVSECRRLHAVGLEKELNSIYETVVDKIESENVSRQAKHEFILAQEKWSEFRDSTCNFMGESTKAWGEWKWTCISQITRSRTEALHSYLDHLESLKCGSPECQKSPQW
ncbi:hypothetical protein GCM10008940_28180 [Microbulbifer agarilyticus]